MGDLIDRQALGVGKCNPEVFNNKGYAEGWNALIDIIEKAPTIEKTGRWIVEPFTKTLSLYKCPRCMQKMWVKTNYCPSCGMKMQDVTE